MRVLQTESPLFASPRACYSAGSLTGAMMKFLVRLLCEASYAIASIVLGANIDEVFPDSICWLCITAPACRYLPFLACLFFIFLWV